jgi:carbonic anhydrase
VKKLIEGIVTFRKGVRPDYRETFARLALGQKPDCLFIACSDSRVVPNLFASTEPGDLFVTRNVGNLVPASGPGGISTGDEAEAAAIEYAVRTLDVRDIIVCGHSSCGAMRTLLDTEDGSTQAVEGAPNLARWLRHALPALEKAKAGITLDPQLAPQDALSQLNVLQQLEHVRSYPSVAERIKEGRLGLHGWWFDIGRADVYAYEEEPNRFLLIDEEEAARILARLGSEGREVYGWHGEERLSAASQ